MYPYSALSVANEGNCTNAHQTPNLNQAIVLSFFCVQKTVFVVEIITYLKKGCDEICYTAQLSLIYN